MKKLLFILAIFVQMSCSNKQDTCNPNNPQFTNCVDGQVSCIDGYVKVPGTSENLGCVKKGLYDFVCLNPCPPYNHILLSSNNFTAEPSVGSTQNDMIALNYITDFGNPNSPKDWMTNQLQLFKNNEAVEGKAIALKTDGICDLYRIWDESKKEFSKVSINGTLNAQKDTLKLNCTYGWDKDKNYGENACNLIFVKTKEL